MICDEAGFLLDEKAWKIIENVPVNEQGFAKAEEVIKALGVKDATAFEALVDAMVADNDSEAPVSDKGDRMSRGFLCDVCVQALSFLLWSKLET